MSSDSSDGVIRLPRGGMLLETSHGYIQYGAVPETIKDTLELPSGVPSVFVVPSRLFAPDRGMSLAELEFPAYWNYFLKGRKIQVVCRKAQRQVLHRVLSEATFGPKSVDTVEFGPQMRAFRPDLSREMAYFRKNPKTGIPMELEDLVEFVEFGTDGRAPLGNGVEIALESTGGLTVIEGGRARTKVHGEPSLPPSAGRQIAGRRQFRPPVLGVTVIGSGHGFDPGNRTSGFLIWIDGRGVMVDPPVDALDWLAGYDFDPRLVDSLILTHCHADHDAGTLQKLLQEGRVSIYTTATVLNSFVTKYSLLTGMPPEQFRQLFDHVPVRAGEPVNLHGAKVTFHYSLHSVPCVGFEVELRGKGLVYPSDTLNDPAAIRGLRDQGVLEQERAKELANFPWHHQLILHEAGIPPIHTPVSALAGLDDAIKDKLLLVHVASKSLPEGSGLRVAPTGLENTLDLGSPRLPVEEALEILDAMARVDILAELPAARAADFLRCVRKEEYEAGAKIVAQGTVGDRFYVILNGHAVVQQGDRVLKTYHDFDFFGETALITGAPRVADVYAKTDLTVLTLDRHDFLHLLRGTDLHKRLEHLAKLREMPTWELLSTSRLFAELTSNQKTQLQALMEPVKLDTGQALGADPIIVATGRIKVAIRDKEYPDIGRGGFAGVANKGGKANKKSTARFWCATHVTGYMLPQVRLQAFFRKNPGVFIRLANLDHSHES